MTISFDPHGVIVVVAVCWIVYVHTVFTVGLRLCSIVNQWWDPPTVDEDDDSENDGDISRDS